jgi:hypothetical protein
MLLLSSRSSEQLLQNSSLQRSPFTLADTSYDQSHRYEKSRSQNLRKQKGRSRIRT